MEISTQEYSALMQQIQSLQDKVDGLTKEKQITSIARSVSELPISGIRINHWPPQYVRRVSGDGAWGQFLSLAKLIHVPSPKAVERRERRERGWHCNDPYFDSDRASATPKVRDLTNDQIEVSVKMLDEMIPIYNRYYKELHPTVLINFKNDCPGKISIVPVREE